MRPRRVQAEQLPRETLWDLIAIARMLYKVRGEAGAAAVELERIKQAGKAFAQALKFSSLPSTRSGTAPAGAGRTRV